MVAQIIDSPKTKSKTTSTAGELVANLERDGVVLLPPLLSGEQLRGMQAAFASRLRCQRWNDVDGFEKNDRYRLFVQNLLTLDQGFMDLALHPLLKQVLHGYLGDHYALVEAKGWKNMPTRRDFHGWHGDQWYDQTKITDRIPREIKLGMYLTDVTSGAFNYLKGSHGKFIPRNLKKAEFRDIPQENVVELMGPAGTAFLFDTSGIHRQAVPILEPRQALFFNFRDPRIPIMREDVDYYRYHPLLLNAAFLGNLNEEDQRILGFGDKANYQAHFIRPTAHRGHFAFIQRVFDVKLYFGEYRERLTGKFLKLIGKKR